MYSMDGEDVLNQVTQNDLLVQTILENLSARQLTQSKAVCHRWFNIVKNIAKNRNYYDTFLVVILPKRFPSENLESEKQRKRKEAFFEELKKSSKILLAENKQSMFQALDCYFSEQLQNFPGLGIFYTSNPSLIRELNRKNYLPPTCCQFYIGSRAGIIGKSSLNSKPFELEKYKLKVNGISGCFINNQWSDFKMTITDWSNLESAEPDTSDADYPIRCLLMFSINFEEDKRFNSFLRRNDKPIAIGGALVDKILYQGRETSFLTLAFSGKDVKAASLVLGNGLIQNELMHFKRCLDFDVDTQNPNITTIGFIFICAARGAEFWLGDLNFESNLLHSIFPNVMFTGCFGNGEYGWNCYDKTNCDQNSRSLDSADLACSFTSIIILVQFTKS